MLQAMRSAAKYIWIFLIIAFVVGFLLLDTSGLLGRDQITPSTAVGSVNGRDILYSQWYNSYQQLAQQQQERAGRALTLDEDRRLQQAAFDQIVEAILLEEEYRRRGIRVADEEIVQAAQFLPPRELLDNPDFQTEGRFDIEKYRRFLSSPVARQQGYLAYLEGYYRSELPRQKLFEQVASGVYVSDADLWRIYQDQHDSAQVSFVAFRSSEAGLAEPTVGEPELRRYFETHRKRFERPGRAWVSVLAVPRVIAAADSAATRSRVLALREEILGGASFADVARRESTDSGSAANGGLLPPATRGRFVAPFERAAYALRLREISQPVLTQFGYHLITLDARKGDTLTLRHILLPVRQSDSSAVLVDRRADSLSAMAAAVEEPARFDSAARTLGLTPQRALAIEDEPLTISGRYIPSVSAWAFGGAVPGETSELFDAEDGYYLARLDSIAPGGEPKFEGVRDQVREAAVRELKLDQLMPRAQQLAEAAARTSLEQAAAQAGRQVVQTPPFTRVSPVPGLGRLNRAIGAAFALPVGAVSEPTRTDDAIFVLRVDRRAEASRSAFEAQKEFLKQTVLEQLRRQRVQDFVGNLRDAADVDDRRDQINAAARRQSAAG